MKVSSATDQHIVIERIKETQKSFSLLQYTQALLHLTFLKYYSIASLMF